jgi:uncharacterized membrane protein YhaH (DUF805 family)
MFNLFKTSGRIGRVSFLIRWFMWAIITIFGLVFLVLIWALTGGTPGEWWWSDFLEKYLGWTLDGFMPFAVIFCFYLVGARIALCGYVKRARDIGVEIPNTVQVFRFFIYRYSGAT